MTLLIIELVCGILVAWLLLHDAVTRDGGRVVSRHRSRFERDAALFTAGLEAMTATLEALGSAMAKAACAAKPLLDAIHTITVELDRRAVDEEWDVS